MKYEPYQIGLAPCPFCRSALHLQRARKIARIYRNDFGDAVYWGRFYVRCRKCNARGPVIGGLTSYTIAEPRTVEIDGKERQVQTAEHWHTVSEWAWNKCWNAEPEGGGAE